MATGSGALVHRTSPKHPLSPLFPGWKTFSTRLRYRWEETETHPLQPATPPAVLSTVTLLSVVRYVFDLSDWDNSCWAVPLGVSGHPASPHYADQASIWGVFEVIPMRYTWKRVKAEADLIKPLTGVDSRHSLNLTEKEVCRDPPL